MIGVKSTGEVEADLRALRGAADRAGAALGCLFSSSDEYEAERVRQWREQAAQAVRQTRLARAAVVAGVTAVLATIFLIA